MLTYCFCYISIVNMSFGEKIFKFPSLYRGKTTILKALNGMGGFSLDPLIEKKKIIDIGCGTIQYFYAPEKTLRRVGIDTSPEMLREAKRLYPHSEYITQSGEHLPYPNDSFDVALLLFMLHHIPSNEWGMFLGEARRVAKKEILIIDHVQHDSPLLSLVQRTYWQLFDGGHTYRKEKEWFSLLQSREFVIKDYKRMGALFGNICYFRLGKS